MSVQIKTMAMKARVANLIRKRMSDLSAKKWFDKTYGFRNFDDITREQKIQFFDEMYTEVKLMDSQLINYKKDRRYKKRIHEERVKRGYNFKKKMSKEEHFQRINAKIEQKKAS